MTENAAPSFSKAILKAAQSMQNEINSAIKKTSEFAGETAEEIVEVVDEYDFFADEEDEDEKEQDGGEGSSTPTNMELSRIEELMKGMKAGKSFTRQQVLDAHKIQNDMRSKALAQNEIGFAQVSQMSTFMAMDGWEMMGYKSFKMYFESPERPFSYSSALRYATVSRFIDNVPIDDYDFLTSFYEQYGLDFEEVLDDNGNVDELASIRKNSLISGGANKTNVRFGDVVRIARLHNGGTINTSTAKELLHDSTQLSEPDFRSNIEDITGGSKTRKSQERLAELGIGGLSVAFSVGLTGDLVDRLRSFATQIEDGYDVSSEFSRNIAEESIERVGNVPSTYFALDDGTVVTTIGKSE